MWSPWHCRILHFHKLIFPHFPCHKHYTHTLELQGQLQEAAEMRVAAHHSQSREVPSFSADSTVAFSRSKPAMASKVMALPGWRKFLTNPSLCRSILNLSAEERERRNFRKEQDICCLPFPGALHCQVSADGFCSPPISSTGRNLPSKPLRVWAQSFHSHTWGNKYNTNVSHFLRYESFTR